MILRFPPGGARSASAAGAPPSGGPAGGPLQPVMATRLPRTRRSDAASSADSPERVEAALQVELGRVGADLHARQLAELAQLLGGELGLRRAAAADHVHLADLGRAQHGHHRLGDVGVLELVGSTWPGCGPRRRRRCRPR